MSNNYISPYYDTNRSMKMQPTHRTVPQDMYTTLSTSTTAPDSPMVVLNPYDRTYKWFHNAFNQYKLHPNQSTARGYHTINTAYGEAPIQTQIQRSCSGYNESRAMIDDMRRQPNSRNRLLTTEVERELVLKHLEKSNANPRVIEEVRQDFYRRDMERQNRPLVTDVERQQLNSRNLELTTEVERQLVLKHLEKSNVNPRVIEEVRQDFHRRDMERR